MSGDSDLPGLLADLGIRLKSMRAGHSEKLRCPKCGGGRTKELSLSVTIDTDGEGFVAKCHRNIECAWTEGRRTSTGTRSPRAPQRVDPPSAPPEHAPTARAVPETMFAFFAQRGISRETVEAFGCYMTRHWFPGSDGDQAALVFPYLVGGRLVNRKYRSATKQFIQEKNPLASLFNVDAVAEPDVVWWVEGEADCMAMHESGYPQTVTLANGAPAELREEDDPRREDDKRFDALRTHSDLLSKVRKFVLAGDMDGPGAVLREELARRMGRHRCWLVSWPEDCKDACDTLRKHGQAGVQAAVEAAEPYPIEGIHSIDADKLLAMRHGQPPATLTTGAIATDRELRFPAEGKLIIVTGMPTHGKSSWLKFIAIHLMSEHNRKFAIFSPEMQPWEQFVAQFAETWTGKKFWPGNGHPGMTDHEVRTAATWLKPRLKLFSADSEDVSPTLDWVLQMARISVLRDGITDLQIDPWNELDHERGNLTESEYIGRSLQRLKAFAMRHGVNIWLVVHPINMRPLKPGMKVEAPTMYDISGGAMWNNKADLGIVVYSPEHTTQILVRKARFTRWARRGAVAELSYDPDTGRYRSAAILEEIADTHEQRRWND